MRSLALVAFLLLAASARPAAAQNRAETERRLEALQAQIAGVERQIRQARSEEAGALAAVDGLETEIRLREELVAGYRSQLSNLQAETAALRGAINRLENEVETAKQAYRARARHAFIRGRVSDLALVLSSGSITQAIARTRYLRRFARQRRRQVERIAVTTNELRAREGQLGGSLRDTQRLLTTSQREQDELAQRRSERGVLVAEVRRRRAALERELGQRQSDADALEGLVRDLVAAERRRADAAARAAAEENSRAEMLAEARRRADEEAARLAEARSAGGRPPSRTLGEPRRTPTPRRNVRPTPRSAAPAARPAAPTAPPPEDRTEDLEGTFRANRGRLPWPADGTVTGAFGTRTDPVYGTRIESPGVDIATAGGAAARAVFGGTVERVGAMATYGTYVMVSHGGFTTVYGNLSSVSVQQGQRVAAGQALGRAGTAEQRRGAALFFALFDGETPVNPLGWLRGR